MAFLGTTTQDAVLNWMLGSAFPPAPSTFTGLWLGNPGDDGSGGTEKTTQITAARVTTVLQNSTVNVDLGVENAAQVDFGQSLTSAGDVDYFAIFDAASAGNNLVYGPLTATRNIIQDDEVFFDPADIQAFAASGTRDMGSQIRDWLIDWLSGVLNFPTAPTGLWVSLWNGDPESGGIEVTTQVRAAGRVLASMIKNANSLENDLLVDFGPADNAVTFDYVAVYSDSTSVSDSNRMWRVNVGSTTTITGKPLQILAGDLTFTID